MEVAGVFQVIVQTNNRYRPLNRGRKPLPAKSKKDTATFTDFVPTEVFRRTTPTYPSLAISTALSIRDKADIDFRKEISKKYTLAPAYNKGAYQVISPECIKDIGR